MNKNNIKIIVLIASVALLGLIAVQLYWIKDAIQIGEERFEQNVNEALNNVAKVAVLDKAVSLGAYAPLATEIKAAFFGKKKAPGIISSFVAGLGGRDITLDSIKEIFRKLNQKEVLQEFIDLKPELLSEEYGG